MGLITRLIHSLNDEYSHTLHSPNLIAEIKQNIKFLLNTNPNDCVSIPNTGLLNLSQSSIEKSELAKQMGQEILNIINDYEKRIEVTNVSYDDSNMPWKLSFLLTCHMRDNRFQEFEFCVDFYNNRYCEVV